MIIDDFDVKRIAIIPYKTNSILIVDPYGELAFPITFQRFKAVIWRRSQIFQVRRRFQQLKLAERRPSKRRGRPAARCPRQPQTLRFRIAEAANHSTIVTHAVHNG